MAYNDKSLSRQTLGAASAAGSANNISDYKYTTADTLATALGATYWNGARNRLKVGDIIEIVAGMGGTLEVGRIIILTVPAAPSNVTFKEIGAVTGVGQGYKIARGQHTTVAAADTVVTGLATVVAVVASYDDDPADANTFVSATIGDQAGTPAAGSVIIKTWKSGDGADVTPVAADSFGKKVNWIAVGS